MDKNTVTGPPPQPQQPPPVQQKSGMQARPPQMMAHYPVPQPQGGGLDSVPFSKSWHVTKIILGSLSMVFSIIALGLGIYFFSTGLHFRAGFQFGLVGTTAALALIWQTAEFITICASSRHRGIHPGANVALHLIIWLMAIVAMSFMAIYVSFDRVDLDNFDDYYGYYDPDELEWIRQLFSVEQAMLAFVTLLLIVHFTLFVRACIECHQYNTATRTIYLPMAMPGPVGPYGYYQPGPPQAQPYPYAMQQAPQQHMPQQQQHFEYYAPPAAAAPNRSYQPVGHDSQRDSTIPSATPPQP